MENSVNTDNSVGIVQTRRTTVFDASEPLKLECGRSLGPVEVAYETYGQLNEDGDNAVLICHALSGDAHVAGKHSAEDRKSGWWDIMVGPGKGIDTNKYYVICSNILGGCKGTTGPGSINPATGEPWGLDFPVITISDMVRVQRALMDKLGIKQLLAVIGGSMGGMQVLDWAVRYGDFVKAALPIASTARLSSQAIAFNAVGRNAILSDPNFAGGRYEKGPTPASGLAIARMIGHITYLSEESMHNKFGRALRYNDRYSFDFNSEFSVETYLDHQGRSFVERFDANSYLYITKAMDYFDLVGRYGSLRQAFRNCTCRFLIASFTSDWLFPPSQSQEMVDALIAEGKDVTYCNVFSPYGHDAFLLEPEVLGSLISGFLDSTHRKLPTGKAIRCGGPDVQETLAGNGNGGQYKWRYDYSLIEKLIAPDSRVLDLGCGEGRLLQLLACQRNVTGQGVEIRQDGVVECVNRGVTVIQHDLDQGLPEFGCDSFDYVILAQTLPEVHNPELVLKEMLRIARQAIVSFPNFAHWHARWQLAVKGRAPVTSRLPAEWYDTERIRFLSLKDFERFCDRIDAKILRKIPITATGKQIHLLPNLRAEQAIYVIARR